MTIVSIERRHDLTQDMGTRHQPSDPAHARSSFSRSLENDARDAESASSRIDDEKAFPPGRPEADHQDAFRTVVPEEGRLPALLVSDIPLGRDAADGSLAVDWRLLPGQGLSYRVFAGAGRQEAAVAAGSAPSTVSAHAAPAIDGATAPIPDAMHPDRFRGGSVGLLYGAPSHQRLVTVEDVGAAIARWPVLKNEDAPDQWQLARFSMAADSGEIVAWLRDYSLDHAEVSDAVSDIRTYCRENAIPLKRVVINGIECWNSNADTEV